MVNPPPMNYDNWNGATLQELKEKLPISRKKKRKLLFETKKKESKYNQSRQTQSSLNKGKVSTTKLIKHLIEKLRMLQLKHLKLDNEKKTKVEYGVKTWAASEFIRFVIHNILNMLAWNLSAKLSTNLFLQGKYVLQTKTLR